MSVDNTDLYCWEESLKTGAELFEKIQEETHAYGNLLIATGGCLKLDTCTWYLLDYDCVDGVCDPAKTEGYKLLIPSDTGSPNPILSLDPHESKKTLGVTDCSAGGNKSHLEHIKDKVNT